MIKGTTRAEVVSMHLLCFLIIASLKVVKLYKVIISNYIAEFENAHSPNLKEWKKVFHTNGNQRSGLNL